MRVLINQVQEGCILTEDVLGLSNQPIIKKNTVITDELLNILKVYLVEEVEVAGMLENGEPFNPVQLQNSEAKNEIPLIASYISAAGNFKKEFSLWQTGSSIDINKIFSIMIPLIEEINFFPSSEIFQINHLSTDKDYISKHAVAVGMLSAFIGRKLNYSKSDIVQLAVGGALCDAGMAKVEPSLLEKASHLNYHEKEEIKRHPEYSLQMVQHLPILKDEVKSAIYEHHERLDGSGYPKGKSGKLISSYGKIFAVADAFHAMNSNRSYRRKYSPYQVLELMLEDYFGQYDLLSIKTLANGILHYSIDSTVKLSNGQLAKIIFIDESAPTRPLIKMISTDEILSLKNNRHLYIEEVMDYYI